MASLVQLVSLIVVTSLAQLATTTLSPKGLQDGGNRHVDTRTTFDTRIRGAYRVADAGDVNGDGTPDLLVSRGEIARSPTRGRTWVLFGPFPRRLNVHRLSASAGFEIDGDRYRAYASYASGAGDVNGDGLDDVAIGAPGACRDGECTGAVYVVLGKTDGAPVDINKVRSGSGGYAIFGGSDGVGWSVAGAGDINQDGLADLATTSPFGGAVYVVFGKEDTDVVELATFDENTQGTAGYRIGGPQAEFNDYYSVANTGDANGDGRPDLVVGVIPETSAPGSVYVVFGKADSLPVDLSRPELYGYRIQGYGSGATTGYSVAAAGDLNADGRSDALIGAPWIHCCDGGDAYVVFGKATPEPVLLEQLGASGQLIKGPRDFENFGTSLTVVGDVNGDQVRDFAVGAPHASHRGRRTSGSVYIVYGQPDRSTVHANEGIRIDGAKGRDCDASKVCLGDLLGQSLAALGDVDDDSRWDLAMGAAFAGQLPYKKNGRVYLLDLPVPSETSRRRTRG